MGVTRAFTLETRLEKVDIAYFIDYISIFNKIYREVWQDYVHGENLNSKYVTSMCFKHNLMKRTVNSIVRDVKGRYSALVELQKQQCEFLERKVQSIDKKIARLTEQLSSMIGIVRENRASSEMLQRYRNNKIRLYSMQQKKQRYANKIAVMRDKHSLAFGSKAFWFKQYNLEANNFRSREAWYNKYVLMRDKYIYYMGSSGETCGNQMFQMSYDENIDCFHIKLRQEKNYPDKYMYLTVNFKASARRYLIEMLKQGQSMTYRILRRGKKWYLQVMFNACFETLTDKSAGCVGVDFNNGFLAISETDKCGNLIKTATVELKYHGSGNKAKTEMQEVVKQLVNYSYVKNKALIIEKLKFSKKKSGALHNKTYNSMLHRLDYSRFAQLCENSATLYGVQLIKVNPAYTSIVARQKYCKTRKLNIHCGAAYVIARRGQGFSDKIA